MTDTLSGPEGNCADNNRSKWPHSHPSCTSVNTCWKRVTGHRCLFWCSQGEEPETFWTDTHFCSWGELGIVLFSLLTCTTLNTSTPIWPAQRYGEGASSAEDMLPLMEKPYNEQPWLRCCLVSFTHSQKPDLNSSAMQLNELSLIILSISVQTLFLEACVCGTL